jgi:hypothetical protein
MSAQGDVAKAIAGPVGMGLAVILVGGVAYWFLSKKLGEAASAVSDAAQYVNPASDKNIIYSGVNDVGSAISGDADFSLGSWFYDITHPNDPYNKAAPSGASYKQQTTAVSNRVYNATDGGSNFISDLISTF